MLYDDLRDPLELLRGERTETRLSRYWSYAGAEDAAGLDSRQISAYSGLMAASQPLIADEVLATYSFRRHRCLLDVGGGNGAFLSAVARRAPHLRLMLFDLPAVIGQARRRFADAPPGERVECFGGNFHVDPLPSGADLISLVRVLHDHDDDDVARLLQAIHRCLPDGGRLLLAEPMAGADSGGQATGAYFGFYLLAMGRGRPRTPAEIGELLQRAGFRRHRLLANRMPLQTRIMIADR